MITQAGERMLNGCGNCGLNGFVCSIPKTIISTATAAAIFHLHSAIITVSDSYPESCSAQLLLLVRGCKGGYICDQSRKLAIYLTCTVISPRTHSMVIRGDVTLDRSR